ncbi:tryptophan 7-halogenase [Nostoc sp. CHAB 5836]|uniref:NAD(P)/FAD-dependent oxidoreductase n=1 Tax=Nostoc sp. CHAB 5836 TaxID=2780404 RepID=UPI001E643B63|nr:tryptophan 7-halogenase [Nostoc sp. CHAB 5836]MCC5617642.1 tryptophan 7-halogenase [Nostoc sp. CHAB 5836]
MFDVVILGSGMSGAILGMILAKNNARVLIIDAAQHPRFAIGESTVPDTTKLLKILSERFDIPEINNISGFVETRHNVTSSCGIKRNFGFVYHREGQEQNPNEVYQVVIPDAFDGPEVHYFRQDVDSYLINVAKNYGATVRENTRIANIYFSEEGVSLESEQGEKFEAQYIVDGTGYRSVVANKFGLRETPSRFKTNSRSIFTHMINVKPFEDCMPEGIYNVPRKWSQGTLHHCFDSGWMWVIPFNNGPEPENALVSVGLQLDSRKFPNQNIPPEKEFQDFIARFPSMARQFESAKSVRNWVSTGDRVQYSSKRTIGYRYCLTSHAAGALGPLYSRGLASTMTALLPLAEELLRAINDGDFSEERFERIDQLQQCTLDNVDAIVRGSYISWRNYDLWNAWVRVWYASVSLSRLHMEAVHKRYRQFKDPEILRELHLPHVGTFCPSIDAYQEFFGAAVKIIDAVEAEEISESNATTQLFKLFKEADFLPPVFNLDKPEVKHSGQYDFEHWLNLVTWGYFKSPKEVKEKLFPGPGEENLTKFKNRYEESINDPRLNEIRKFLVDTVNKQAI